MMPELPEVETVVRLLRRQGLVRRWVTGCEVFWERTVGGDALEFCRQVTGLEIRGLGRRGKYIVLPVVTGSQDDSSRARRGRTGRTGRTCGTLLVHLRMSGRLYLCLPSEERSGYERAVLTLDDGRELRFHDPRKFGRMELAGAGDRRLRRLGVEPLGKQFSEHQFVELIRGRRRMLKPLLLDQTVIAGLGNIYVDEALWEAGLHPLRLAGSLSVGEARRLAQGVVTVLRRGIANSGTSLGRGQINFVLPGARATSSAPLAVAVDARNQEDLRVFRRTGGACFRCGAQIERLIVAQRSTHICPRCQQPQ